MTDRVRKTGRQGNRATDTETDKKRARQFDIPDRQTHRQTNGNTDRQTNRQTVLNTDSSIRSSIKRLQSWRQRSRFCFNDPKRLREKHKRKKIQGDKRERKTIAERK